MMLKYPGETRAADLVEDAVWKMFEQKRVVPAPGGAIEGGAGRVVRELSKILNRRLD